MNTVSTLVSYRARKRKQRPHGRCFLENRIVTSAYPCHAYFSAEKLRDPASLAFASSGRKLLQRNFPSRCFDFRFPRLGVFLLHAGFEHGRSGLDESLGLRETERENLLHHLDDGDFLLAYRREFDIELRLLFGRRNCRSRRRNCCRRNSPLLFDCLHERIELENAHLFDCFDYLILVHNFQFLILQFSINVQASMFENWTNENSMEIDNCKLIILYLLSNLAERDCESATR